MFRSGVSPVRSSVHYKLCWCKPNDWTVRICADQQVHSDTWRFIMQSGWKILNVLLKWGWTLMRSLVMFRIFLLGKGVPLTYALQLEIRAVHHFVWSWCCRPASPGVNPQLIASTASWQGFITQSLTECASPGLTLSLMAAPFFKP